MRVISATEAKQSLGLMIDAAQREPVIIQQQHRDVAVLLSMLEDRQNFLHQLSFIVEVIPHVNSIKVCRDPKDDKFLSRAMSGNANILLTGDNNPNLVPLEASGYLLVQHTYRKLF